MEGKEEVQAVKAIVLEVGEGQRGVYGILIMPVCPPHA